MEKGKRAAAMLSRHQLEQGTLLHGLTVLPLLQEDAERQATADWDFLCKPSTVQMLRQAMELLAAKAKGKAKVQAKL